MRKVIVLLALVWISRDFDSPAKLMDFCNALEAPRCKEARIEGWRGAGDSKGEFHGWRLHYRSPEQSLDKVEAQK